MYRWVDGGKQIMGARVLAFIPTAEGHSGFCFAKGCAREHLQNSITLRHKK
jgi:hypothetical protein